ncbi:HMG domain-containing protein 4 [Holothuria leucospilota]|uniref:HMG domain-containing protein 4 n=1 Tax=Holothuria leucospilota TaxID=206669 RepID=A0A9Q1C8W5_HOLLE|nr:HMG domain-containing protein 4 [Holothuria leucospilota]
MLQGLKSPSSGGDDLGDLNFSSHGDDLISQLTASSGHFDPNSLLDESPTEEVPLKPVVIKSSDKKNDKSKLKEKAKKKKKPITAYMMWCKANRAKIVEQFPGLDFASYSRKLGELWHKLPEKEKTKWKHKQRSMLMKHKNVPALSRLKKQSRQRGVTKSRPKFKFPPPHTDPIDIAAHLKLLGESLGNVGRNLMTHAGGETEVHGSISVLMDSMLSAIGPLMCLTSQVEELNVVPQKTQVKELMSLMSISSSPLGIDALGVRGEDEMDISDISSWSVSDDVKRILYQDANSDMSSASDKNDFSEQDSYLSAVDVRELENRLSIGSGSSLSINWNEVDEMVATVK